MCYFEILIIYIAFFPRNIHEIDVCFLLMFQLITAKLIQVGSNMPSSPDSSSDSSAGSPHHTFDGPNIEAESCLPGVVRRYIIPCRTK